jgi:hypothetical protein
LVVDRLVDDEALALAGYVVAEAGQMEERRANLRRMKRIGVWRDRGGQNLVSRGDAEARRTTSSAPRLRGSA